MKHSFNGLIVLWLVNHTIIFELELGIPPPQILPNKQRCLHLDALAPPKIEQAHSGLFYFWRVNIQEILFMSVARKLFIRMIRLYIVRHIRPSSTEIWVLRRTGARKTAVILEPGRLDWTTEKRIVLLHCDDAEISNNKYAFLFMIIPAQQYSLL